MKEEETGVVIPSPTNEERVIVRFKKEAGIRYKEGKCSSLAHADVTGIQKVLKKYPGIKMERMFEQSEDTLDREVAGLTSKSGGEVPALSGYYSITAKNQEQAEKICAELKENPLVDEVYIEPPAFPALFTAPAKRLPEEAAPLTPDFSSLQGYLNVAPEGVDARYAWTLAGGKGDKVQIIDIEGAWNFSQEDLVHNQGGVVGGIPTSDSDWENHGTAVHGEIGGDENQIGILGIAPYSKFSGVSIFGPGNSTSKAIKTAADKLNPGDIILIELHRPGPNATGSGQFGFIPIEWWSADFDTIKYATSKGIIVIAAAGNGSQNLDDPVYEGKFIRNNRDSGAILVGAGAPPSGNYGPDRSRLSFSNYGEIVDAQGWGREVTTTGYGDLQGGSDKNRFYTKTFSGTSSASPIVVGAVACLQSIQKSRGETPLTYNQIRDVLRNTGSPQTDAPDRPKSQRIGNRPDIKAAKTLISPQVQSGIATKYWFELIPIPSSPERLWLFVDNKWRTLTNAKSLMDLVQRAFIESHKVRVWYDGDNIKGLAIEGS